MTSTLLSTILTFIVLLPQAVKPTRSPDLVILPDGKPLGDSSDLGFATITSSTTPTSCSALSCSTRHSSLLSLATTETETITDLLSGPFKPRKNGTKSSPSSLNTMMKKRKRKKLLLVVMPLKLRKMTNEIPKLSVILFLALI